LDHIASLESDMTYGGLLQGPSLDREHPIEKMYEKDVVLWAEHQEKALLERRVEDLDFENLAEEMRLLGMFKERKVSEHLRSLITTLLKWKYCQEARKKYEHLTVTWNFQIETDRREIEYNLHCSPSLHKKIPDLLLQVYGYAVRRASRETGINVSIFPKKLEWTLEEMIQLPLDPITLPERVAQELPIETAMTVEEALEKLFDFDNTNTQVQKMIRMTYDDLR